MTAGSPIRRGRQGQVRRPGGPRGGHEGGSAGGTPHPVSRVVVLVDDYPGNEPCCDKTHNDVGGEVHGRMHEPAPRFRGRVGEMRSQLRGAVARGGRGARRPRSGAARRCGCDTRMGGRRFPHLLGLHVGRAVAGGVSTQELVCLVQRHGQTAPRPVKMLARSQTAEVSRPRRPAWCLPRGETEGAPQSLSGGCGGQGVSVEMKVRDLSLLPPVAALPGAVGGTGADLARSATKCCQGRAGARGNAALTCSRPRRPSIGRPPSAVRRCRARLEVTYRTSPPARRNTLRERRASAEVRGMGCSQLARRL